MSHPPLDLGSALPPKPADMPQELYDRIVAAHEAEQAARVQQRRRGDRGALTDFGAGMMEGMGRTGTSLVRLGGKLFGSSGMQDWADQTDREMDVFYDPEGTAGNVGKFTGRALGEAALIMGPGKFTAAGKVGRALQGGAAGARVLEGTSLAAAPLRGAIRVAPYLPAEAIMGAASSEETSVKGMAGDAAQRAGLALAGGAVMEGLAGVSRAAAKPFMRRPSAPTTPAAAPGIAETPAAPGNLTPEPGAPAGSKWDALRSGDPGVEIEVERAAQAHVKANPQAYEGLDAEAQREVFEQTKQGYREQILAAQTAARDAARSGDPGVEIVLEEQLQAQIAADPETWASYTPAQAQMMADRFRALLRKRILRHMAKTAPPSVPAAPGTE